MRTSIHAAEPLSDHDLAAVAGGMKWTPIKNDEVIDARGGQMQVMFWNVTFDVNGNPSSITPR